MIKSYEQLSDIQLDALKEIGNIGAGNAAVSLSVMLDEKVEMEIPEVKVQDCNSIIESLGGAERMVVAVLLSFSGDISGVILFLIDVEDAVSVTDLLIKDEKEKRKSDIHGINEIRISAIKEIGNILSSSYLSSIASLTNMTVDVSAPSAAVDMLGSALSTPLTKYGASNDNVMLIEEKLFFDKRESCSNIIMFTELSSLESMFTKLGMDI